MDMMIAIVAEVDELRALKQLIYLNGRGRGLFYDARIVKKAEIWP
jgi:hypothetical protein